MKGSSVAFLALVALLAFTIPGFVFGEGVQPPAGDGERKIDLRSLSLDHALVIGRPDAPIKVVVFTDPGCHYCEKLHREIKRLVQKRPDVTFFMKVFTIISRNPAAAKNIVCANFVSALEDAYARKSIPARECPSTEIEDNLRFAAENGINGAPAIVFPDGTVHLGYYDAERLEERIDRTAGKR
jgi:thiol:disulfide interchange protein DsbC